MPWFKKDKQEGPDEDDEPVPDVLQDEVLTPDEMRYLREMIKLGQSARDPYEAREYNAKADDVIETRNERRKNK